MKTIKVYSILFIFMFILSDYINAQVDSTNSNASAKENEKSIQIFLANSMDFAYQQYISNDYSWTTKLILSYQSGNQSPTSVADETFYNYYDASFSVKFNYDFYSSFPTTISGGWGPVFYLHRFFAGEVEEGIDKVHYNYLVIGVGISASFMMKLNLNENFFLIGEYNLTGMVTNTENFIYRTLWTASNDKDGGARSWELRLDSLKVGFGVYF